MSTILHRFSRQKGTSPSSNKEARPTIRHQKEKDTIAAFIMIHQPANQPQYLNLLTQRRLPNLTMPWDTGLMRESARYENSL